MDAMPTHPIGIRQPCSATLLRQVAADLGGSDYLAPIIDATKDIRIQIVFNNAGYMLTGFFHTR